MKTLSKFFAVLLLTLVLSLPVIAGNMPTGIADPPLPPDSATTINTDGGETTAVDPATIALSFLLQNLAALF